MDASIVGIHGPLDLSQRKVGCKQHLCCPAGRPAPQRATIAPLARCAPSLSMADLPDEPAAGNPSPAAPVALEPPEPPELPTPPQAAAAAPEADAPAAADAAAAAAAPADAAAGTPRANELSPAQCQAALGELFPALFGAGSAPRPLKLRIQSDIQQRAPGRFSRRTLGLFFSRYTTTNAYLKALIAATTRFDLEGQPAGEIAAEHRAAAEAELARRLEIREQRIAEQRAAVRAQRAERPGPRQQATASGSGQAIPPSIEGAPADAAALTPPRERAPRRPDQRADRHPQQRADRHPQQRRDPRPQPSPDRRPGARPEPGQRPPRPSLPDRPPRTDRPPRRDPVEARQDPPPRQPAPPRIEDPAARERHRLVRDWESSPLSRANFCALKGISEAVLDEAVRLVRG